MSVLAQNAEYWNSAALLLPYLFAACLMAILAAVGWEAGERLKDEPLMPVDSQEAQDHQLRPSSVMKLVLLNFATLGGFSFFWLSTMHGKLPKIRPSDPSPGRAIGLSLIPVFDFYWVAYSFSRLVLRIDQQRKMRELEPIDIRGPLVGMMVCLLLTTVLALSVLGSILKWHAPLPLLAIGVLPIIVCWLLVTPFACWFVQSSINSLCEHGDEIDEEDEELAQVEQDEASESDSEAAVDQTEEEANLAEVEDEAEIEEIVDVEEGDEASVEPTDDIGLGDDIDEADHLTLPEDEGENLAAEEAESKPLDTPSDEADLDDTFDFLSDE